MVHRPQRPSGEPTHDEPGRPDARDVSSHRDEHLAEVDDLGLGGGVLDRRLAVGEDSGRDDVLGGADAREAEDDVGAVQPVGGRVELPWPNELGADFVERGHVHVDRSGAEVITTRHRQLTRPHRVSSGPGTLIEARIRSTCSYGATGVRPPSFVDVAGRTPALPP